MAASDWPLCDMLVRSWSQNLADKPCEERRKLEGAVILVVKGVYAAKDADRGLARIAENEAVEALNAHIRAHGCKNI